MDRAAAKMGSDVSPAAGRLCEPGNEGGKSEHRALQQMRDDWLNSTQSPWFTRLHAMSLVQHGHLPATTCRCPQRVPLRADRKSVSCWLWQANPAYLIPMAPVAHLIPPDLPRAEEDPCSLGSRQYHNPVGQEGSRKPPKRQTLQNATFLSLWRAKTTAHVQVGRAHVILDEGGG